MSGAAVDLFSPIQKMKSFYADIIIVEPIPKSVIGIAIMDWLHKPISNYKLQKQIIPGMFISVLIPAMLWVSRFIYKSKLMATRSEFLCFFNVKIAFLLKGNLLSNYYSGS